MENIFVEFLPPWVETGLQPAFYDKESGTVLQQVARMYAKVNWLIKMFNKLSKDTTTEINTFEHDTTETVNDYIARFVALKDFVDDYFENLDVQEEINNKLDEMADDGTLLEIVGQYLNSTAVWGFDTVASMKSSSNLIDGSFAHTLGYHSKNDGGEAFYKIRTVTNDDTIDEMLIIEIGDPENQLVAELIIGDSVCPEMLGAYGDGTHDDTLAIAKAVTLNTKIVMSKNYLITDNIRIGDTDNLDIEAEKSSITYNGDSDDYAFLIQHLNGGNIKFGKIESNGGCIKFYSSQGSADRVQYLTLSFNHMRAGENGICIYGKVENTGWLQEIKLNGGYFSRGSYGVYLTNLASSTQYGIGAWKFNNIGFEGTDINIHLDSASTTYQRGHFFNYIRYAENPSATLFETTGRVGRLTMISDAGLDESRLDFELTKLYNCELKCPVYETGTTNVKATGIYYNLSAKRYILDNSTWSLPTKNTTNVVSGTIRFMREGNMCIIRIYDLKTLTNSGNLVDSLPFAPKESIANYIGNYECNKFMRVYANSSGELKFNMPAGDVGTVYYGELVFFTDTNINLA